MPEAKLCLPLSTYNEPCNTAVDKKKTREHTITISATSISDYILHYLHFSFDVRNIEIKIVDFLYVDE